MRVTDTSGPTGSSVLLSAPSPASTTTSSSANISANSLKNGIGLAWTVSGGGGRGAGGLSAGAGVGVGVVNGTVSMANVLDFLLTSAQLHRVAGATVEKVRAGGRLITGSGGPENQAGRNGHASSSSASGNVGVSTSSTSILPSPSETWSRLLGNPASSSQDHTLALLQMALQDGLLDSILPYMVSSLNLGGIPTLTPTHLALTPANPALTPANPTRSSTPTLKGSTTSKGSGGPLMTCSTSHTRSPTRDGVGREVVRRPPTPAPTPVSSLAAHMLPDIPRSPTTPSTFKTVPDRSPGIVIHVCDEARGLRQDFTCPRDLLIHHIGYFADVTAGQRLEDVDISVHCDVSIFEWLLRWVKRGQTEDHLAPVLEPKTAVSILISADFLKMTPLVEEVLQYVHDNINLILEAQVNLNCLSDAILARLARVFTHWELEGLRDRRDRIQSKLYARFLQTLCDVAPAPLRGIFKTAATLYRCSECGQVLSRAVERLVTCVPANTSITTSGHVFYSHSRDATWSLTEHVKQLKTDLKTWRLVYWRLWGQVHFLPCSTCGAVFPGCEMHLCRTHRLDASSCDLDIFFPSDVYPCCGARALRFSPLPVRNGCQVTEHTVQLAQGDEETWGPIPLIYDDLLTFQLLICLDPPQHLSPARKSVLWAGVPLVPTSRAERSLLDRSWLSHYLHAGERDTHTTTNRASTSEVGAPVSTTTTSNMGAPSVSVAASSESSSDEEEGGGRPGLTSGLRATLMRRAARARRIIACEVMAEPSLRWDAGRSTRHNQDAQRERESRALRDLTAWLTLAAPNTHDAAHGSHKAHRGRPDRRRECSSGPDPGCYYKLEAEFRERNGGHSHTHSGGGGGTFRAKVQAISRIKMRLRHRAAFSASR